MPARVPLPWTPPSVLDPTRHFQEAELALLICLQFHLCPA